MTPRARGIIVEGPDCSGKSSLVRRLKAELSGGWDVMQMGHKDGDQFARYLRVYLDAQRLLLDRSHFSERVYGDLLRGGRHFTAWQRALLDRLAEHEFATVLCTAPAALLWERYKARNAAVARGERAYVQAGGAMQATLSFDDLARAREKFIETVGPHAAAIHETDRMESLEHTVRVVLRQVKTGPAPARPEGAAPAEPSVILVEGSGAHRSHVAQALADSLGAWSVARLGRDPNEMVFARFLAAYLRADRTVFDGAHLTAAAEAGQLSTVTSGEAIQAAQLAQYVSSHGAIFLCAGSDRSDEAIRRTLEHAQVPYEEVRADAVFRAGEIAAAALNRQRRSHTAISLEGS